jgi:hypothetical protein
MVGVIGFEPTTPSSRTRCSTRLSHTPPMTIKGRAAAYTSRMLRLQALRAGAVCAGCCLRAPAI